MTRAGTSATAAALTATLGPTGASWVSVGRTDTGFWWRRHDEYDSPGHHE